MNVTGPDHGDEHPRAEFRDDVAEMRADKQDRRLAEGDVTDDRLATALAVQTEQLRLLTERMERLVALVTAVAAKL